MSLARSIGKLLIQALLHPRDAYASEHISNPTPEPSNESIIADRRHRIDVPYVLPKDLQEIDRLDLQHYALRAILKGNYAAPIPDTVHTILDIGAGSGRWAIEMAESFPQAQVVGVDIEFPPVTPPSNCSFVLGNILTGLDFADNTFDYVHQRLLVGAIPAANWPFVVREQARVTTPDGWVELLESGDTFYQTGPITHEFLSRWPAAASMTGFDLAGMSHLDDLFNAAGLVNVQMRRIPIPLGAWAGQEGEMMARDIQAIFRAFKAIFVARMGMPEQQFTDMIEALPTEWEQQHTSYEFYQVFGQKPTA
jgi:SAM-dependent methyltransferase